MQTLAFLVSSIFVVVYFFAFGFNFFYHNFIKCDGKHFVRDLVLWISGTGFLMLFWFYFNCICIWGFDRL